MQLDGFHEALIWLFLINYYSMPMRPYPYIHFQALLWKCNDVLFCASTYHKQINPYTTIQPLKSILCNHLTEIPTQNWVDDLSNDRAVYMLFCLFHKTLQNVFPTEVTKKNRVLCSNQILNNIRICRIEMCWNSIYFFRIEFHSGKESVCIEKDKEARIRLFENDREWTCSRQISSVFYVHIFRLYLDVTTISINSV